MNEYTIFIALLWVIVPTLLATLIARALIRQQKPVIGILIGIGLIMAFMVSLWQYGLFEVAHCIETCTSVAPREACKFSCDHESSWPFIYLFELLSLFDIVIFLIVGNFLARRSKHDLNFTSG